MKENSIIVEKTENGGYTVQMKLSFFSIIKMAFSGLVTLNLDAGQGSALSKALYTPVKREYRPRKRPASSVNK